MAATAESVLKPDFQTAAQALHLHRRARTAARVDPQLRDQRARAARRGMGGDDVPRLGLPAHGRARLPRPGQARGIRRAGRRLLHGAGAGRGDHATPTRGGLAMGMAVHTDMAMPPILAFGTEEQKQEWVVPAIKGEKILCLGITEPDAGSDVSGIKTRAVKRRRRLRDQRLQDLHHQRPPRRRDRARDEDRPGRRLRRLHAVPRADGRARRDPREEAGEARHARLRHGAAGLPGRARARRRRCSARSARASTTSCGSSRASA